MATKPARFRILGDATEAVHALRQVADEMETTESKAKDVAGGLDKLGKGLTIAVTAPLTALAVSAGRMASDLEQSVGGVEAVFGRLSEKILSASEDAADFVGLSENAYNQLAARLGGQLQTFGFSLDETVVKTKELISTGADLAATYGGTVAEAVDAISALLRGESNPIERYAIAINQTAINARAMALGLAENTTQVDVHAKAVSALQLLTEQAARAQGQFAREADTAAGAQQRLAADWENARAELGQAFLPVMSDAFSVARDLLGAFNELPEGAKNMAVGVGTAAAALGPLLVVAGKVVGAIDKIKNSSGGLSTFLTGPWGVAIGAATVLLGAFVKMHLDAEARVRGFREAMSGAPDDVAAYTEELVKAQFANEQWLAGLRNSGVNLRDVIAAINGEIDAEKVIGPLRQARNEHIATWIQRQIGAREEASRINAELRVQQEQAEGTIGGVDSLAEKTLRLAAAQGEAAAKADEHTAAIARTAAEQRKAVDPLFALTEANRDLDEAQQAYNDTLVEFGPKSAEARDAGLDLAQAQLDLNAAAERYAEEGGPDSLDALSDMLAQAGLTAEMIRSIISAISDLNATEVTNPLARSGHGSGGGGIAAFDEGGIVPGPRGRPRLIVAHGGETVLPTHKGNGGGVAAMSFNPTFYVTVSGSADPRRTANDTVRELQRALDVFKSGGNRPT